MPEVRGGRRMDKGHKRIWGDDRTVIHLDYSDGCMSVSVKIHRTVHKNGEFHCVKIDLSKLDLQSHSRTKRHGHNNSLMPTHGDSHLGLDCTSELAKLCTSLFSPILPYIL